MIKKKNTAVISLNSSMFVRRRGFAKINTCDKHNNFHCSFDSFWIHDLSMPRFFLDTQPKYAVTLIFSCRKTAICWTLLLDTAEKYVYILYTDSSLTLLTSRSSDFSWKKGKTNVFFILKHLIQPFMQVKKAYDF